MMNNVQGNTGDLACHRGGCILPDSDRNFITEDGTSFSSKDGTLEISASCKNDNINAHINKDGSVDVTVNGKTYRFSAEEAKNIVIKGGDGNDNISVTGDQLCGSEKNITIDGGNGDDLLRGGSGDETLRGGDGNDTLIGGGGDDCLAGGKGEDSIWGGSGNDRIYGQDGNDTLVGNEGDDLIYGGRGDDNIWGSAGNDNLNGGDGNDSLVGGCGDDYISGNAGRDNMWGEWGNDLLTRNPDDGYVDAGGQSGDRTHCVDDQDDISIIEDPNADHVYKNSDDSSGNRFNPFDPLGLFSGGGPSLGGDSFPLNLISPK
ncbi:MAG: calcium-binding protein [Candidatus Thiodiazotropha sp. DIVDIV]